MKTTYKGVILLYILLIVGIAASSQSLQTVSMKDFSKAIGSWKGIITYLDYSSGESFTMPAEVDVQCIPKTPQFLFKTSYPDEPQANSVDTIELDSNGRKINNEIIQSSKRLSDGGIEIVSFSEGRDGNDNQLASFKFTYIIGPHKLSKKKEVQFKGTDQWIQRHLYSYTR